MPRAPDDASFELPPRQPSELPRLLDIFASSPSDSEGTPSARQPPTPSRPSASQLSRSRASTRSHNSPPARRALSPQDQTERSRPRARVRRSSNSRDRSTPEHHHRSTYPHSHTTHAYGHRIPLARPGHRQSLYDWAPVSADELRSLPLIRPPSDDLAARAELWVPVTTFPNPSPAEDLTARYPHTFDPPPQPTIAQQQGGQSSGQSPLRTALMHSLRHGPRRTGRARGSQRGLQERGRQQENEPPNGGGMSVRVGSPGSLMQGRWSSLRGGSSNLPSANEEVEEAMSYLAHVRHNGDPKESLREALGADCGDNGDDWLDLLKEMDKSDDLIKDTLFLRPAETSWLKPGGVFWGSQTTPPPPHRGMHPLPSSVSHDGRPSGLSSGHWPVKVCISSVDYEQMRLTGTMEAFTGCAPSKSISTYLEGEIIDFTHHTFVTGDNLLAGLRKDADNWRKLEPFLHMPNEDIVKSLVSRRFMKEVSENWVFMRWKEQCFISPEPEPERVGLTIGGFYYLSLRRDNGLIQGYYWDPASSPFQELTLKPQKRLFPSYQFR